MDLTLNQIVDQLEQKKKNCLDFRSVRRDIRMSNHGSIVSIKGKEYELTVTGKKSLCKILGVPNYYFKKYPVQTEFAEHINTLLQTKPDDEVLIRLENEKIRALLNPNYAIFDNQHALSSLISLQDKLPNTRVSILKEHESFSVYQITYGTSKIQSDETYPMIRIINSEVGLGALEIEMGLFRLICTNGAIRKERDFGYLRWDHTLKTLQKLNTWITFSIDRGITKWYELQELFENSREIPISRPFIQTVQELIETNKISTRFASRLLKAEEAIPVRNKFDVINLITAEAQKEKFWNSQGRYENVSTLILSGKVIS